LKQEILSEHQGTYTRQAGTKQSTPQGVLKRIPAYFLFTGESHYFVDIPCRGHHSLSK